MIGYLNDYSEVLSTSSRGRELKYVYTARHFFREMSTSSRGRELK